VEVNEAIIPLACFSNAQYGYCPIKDYTTVINTVT
jgi:hypothetical protein